MNIQIARHHLGRSLVFTITILAILLSPSYGGATTQDIKGKVMVSPLGCFDASHPNHGPQVSLSILDEENNVFYEIDPKDGAALLPHSGKEVRIRVPVSGGNQSRAAAMAAPKMNSKGKPLSSRLSVANPVLLEVLAPTSASSSNTSIQGSGNNYPSLPSSQGGPKAFQSQAASPQAASAQSAAPVTTMLSTLIIFAQFTDVTWSQSEMDGVMNVMFHNPANVNEATQHATRGIYGVMEGTASGDPGSEVVTLPYTAAYNQSKYSIAYDAEQAATNDIYSYDRVMVFFTSGTVSFTAYAYYSGGSSAYSWGRRKKLETLVHELGHNLWLGHSDSLDPVSGAHSEYNDPTCIMGPSPSANESAVFNPVKQDQLDVDVHYPGSFVTPSSDATFDIYPNALDLRTSPGVRVIKFPSLTHGSENNYVAYIKEMSPYGKVWDTGHKDKVVLYKQVTTCTGHSPNHLWSPQEARSGKMAAIEPQSSQTKDVNNTEFLSHRKVGGQLCKNQRST
jgi:hypothetical protein